MFVAILDAGNLARVRPIKRVIVRICVEIAII
jgi:hypothetical protein